MKLWSSPLVVAHYIAAVNLVISMQRHIFTAKMCTIPSNSNYDSYGFIQPNSVQAVGGSIAMLCNGLYQVSKGKVPGMFY